MNQDPEPDYHYPEKVSSGQLLGLSVVSALVYLLAAIWIYNVFYEDSIKRAFEHGWSTSGQLAIGVAAGYLAAILIDRTIKRPPVSEILNDFYIVNLVSQSRFTVFDHIQLSLFAGVGEELLFRGAIQPLIGIWLTSLIFIAIHGYFKFKSTGHLLFVVMMFALSMVLGYLFEYVGLISAMGAHAVYDVIMLQRISAHR